MQTETIKVTEAERELIEGIRNLKNSHHNYSFELELWIREKFENLINE